MKINVIAFGYLAETIGKNTFELEGIADVHSLKMKLEKDYPGINKMDYKIAVNKEVVKENIQIDNNSEVALLPPFAGG